MDVWLVYMMGLLEVLPARAVPEILKRFPFSDHDVVKLKAARAEGEQVIRRLTRSQIKPAEAYRSLSGLSDETLLALMAKSKGEAAKRQISSFLTNYQHVKPILTGEDLKKMGLKPGPQFKKLLDCLLDARLNGEVKTEEEERALVSRITKSGAAISSSA
jgi:tRNA nucleotidyltransferase (CCA-adding enzyme)